MSETLKSRLLEQDLYKLFDVDETSTIDQIKKAYRKKALELHPDKNLENKEEAQQKFVELGKAFEILSDEAAKAAYDAVRRQKREKAKRDQQLDEKRRKLKEDLERREAAGRDRAQKQTEELKRTKEEEWLKKEIDRLRKAGSKLLEEELNFINEQVRQEKKRTTEDSQSQGTKKIKRNPIVIKVSWKNDKNTSEKIKIDKDLLEHLFSKYGQIDNLVAQKSIAILEFKNDLDAVTCLNDEINLKTKYGFSLTRLGDSKKSETIEKPATKPNETAPKQDFDNFEDLEDAILRKMSEAAEKS